MDTKITQIYVKDLDVSYELIEGEWVKRQPYTCVVCGEPNNYWWMYCQAHEAQCEREMDEALDVQY